MKKVLITGANSYIGTAFENRAKRIYPNQIHIETIDMRDVKWKRVDFSKYDSIFHVAGIAHADIGNVSNEAKALYYKVNRDLAIETAEKAKNESVSQFIFMSSIIIYGDSAGLGRTKVINKLTEPMPANFYGDSKWQADKAIRALSTNEFKTVVIRPPMIYGKNSKGNYPLLSKLAQKLPVFPNIQNERSICYIENLCELICKVILQEKSGIFYPQNKDYASTAQIVKEIAKVHNHNIIITQLLNPFVYLSNKIPGKISILIDKAFGSLCYAKEISSAGLDYQKYSLTESIKETEK